MKEANELTLEDAVELYESVGLKSRNMKFFSKWVYEVFKNLFYLPGVDLGYIEQLAIDKTKLSVFAILVDDLADNVKLRNKHLLEKALQIPWNENEKYDTKYLETTQKIWKDVINSIQKYPRYEEFEEIFKFDLNQFLDAIKYAYLINTMEINNPLEDKKYFYHNMMIMLFLDIDIMCSPYFKKKDLSKFRPLAHWIQDICHVGNILSTFKREIKEEDFSSPIISLGLEEGLFTRKDIKNNPEDVLKKLETLIPLFIQRVDEDFAKIKYNGETIESIDVNEFYSRLIKVFNCFLERPKYWEITSLKSEKKEDMSLQMSQMIIDRTCNWIRI